MMYEVLYKFLVKYKEIHLPGIGTIALRAQPAESKFVDQSFLPPRYSITFEKARHTVSAEPGNQQPHSDEELHPSKKLLSWLSANFDITEREAITRFNDFLFDLRRDLEAGKTIVWNGVGTFQKNDAGETAFHSDEKGLPWLKPATAKKVIRDNAEHTMLVGEREKTSVEMSEMLLRPKAVKEKREYWWVWPLAVIIAIFIFLGWYFSEHGISGTATGNNHKNSPVESPSGSK